jgi:hypothetical protein
MFGRIIRALRPPKSADPAAFGAFLERQTSFVVRKTIEDYCRVKAGRSETKMFADPDFQSALSHARWQTYAAAAQDMAALAEAWLRPEVPGREALLAESLAGLLGNMLRHAEAPAEERATLDDATEALPRLLAGLQERPPQSADRRTLLAELPLLATIPVHADQRVGETPAIRGALRFHMVSTQQEMERAFLPGPLAARLLQDLDPARRNMS